MNQKKSYKLLVKDQLYYKDNILYNIVGDFVNKIKLDYDKCIGCGLCFYLNKDMFTTDENGYCRIKKKQINSTNKDSVKKIVKVCPTKALKIVKAD